MSFEWHPKTPLEFVIFFVLLWCTVSFVLATIGGWRRLAEAYRFEGTFEGSRWRFTSARMRWGVNYNGCLTIGANERRSTPETVGKRFERRAAPPPKAGPHG